MRIFRNRFYAELIRLVAVFIIGIIIGICYPKEEHLSSEPFVAATVKRSNSHIGHNTLTILIVSAPKNSDKRDILRKSWLQGCHPPTCIHKFAIGTKNVNLGQIKDANRNDILALPQLSDSYSALTQKVGLSFSWISRNMNSKFVFKGDEDTFVNIEELLKELAKYSSNLYMGYFTGRARVKTKGPWAEPNWHLCDYYLPNARGGGYVLGKQNVDFIADNYDKLQKWNSEDISVGAWLAPVNVDRVHSIRFDTESESRGCHNSYIVTHKQDLSEYWEKWNFLHKTGDLCIDEIPKKPGYEYNWNVPPSQCCTPKSDIP